MCLEVIVVHYLSLHHILPKLGMAYKIFKIKMTGCLV